MNRQANKKHDFLSLPSVEVTGFGVAKLYSKVID